MNVTAVILAGGASTRFSPLTVSKPLFCFKAKPIILYLLEKLKYAGFKDVLIITNPEDNEQLIKFIKNNKRIQIVVQKEPNGMADALLSAENFLTGKPIFVLNASDLVEQTLFEKAAKRIQTAKNNFLVAKKQDNYFDGGYLQFSGGKLAAIVEKPGEGNQPSKLINLVFHYFKDSKEFMRILKKSKSDKDDVYELALSSLITSKPFEVIEYTGFWQPLKYPWHLLEMMNTILHTQLIAKNHAATVSDSAKIDGNVSLESGVKVLENAVIKGPSFIGKNTIIGTNSLIINSMIEESCVIGFGSEVCRSYIGPRTWLHHNYIGDSVLEGDNYCGSGAATANFRFDERTIRSVVSKKIIDSKRVKLGMIMAKKARLGVNACIMPGVKIGHSSFVGPGVVLVKDLAPNSLITVLQTTNIKKNLLIFSNRFPQLSLQQEKVTE
jgi:bifunctional UDP-N-acetylglucosamine pyrophosphorylase/glucosamine-1-phosphate N-acetyltransferase